MEFINKVELAGKVGTINVVDVAGKKMARMSLMTQKALKDLSGMGIIESTWFTVVAWEGKDIRGLGEIRKGDAIHVLGRMKTNKYTDENGGEHFSMEVIANSVEKMDS